MSVSLVELARGNHAGLLFTLADPCPRRTCTCERWDRGFNHCSLHCRLAKFRGLMIRGKHGAVIGRKTHFFVCAQLQLSGFGICLANHSAVFPPDHQTTDFRHKRQCKLQWLTPPIKEIAPSIGSSSLLSGAWPPMDQY
jgi:hypothetical protein